MDGKRPNALFQECLDYIWTTEKLPVLAPQEYQAFCGDIIYLLDVRRAKICDYPWVREAGDTPILAKTGLRTSITDLQESRSARRKEEETERRAQLDPNEPYPKNFDASKKESLDRIAIKIQPQFMQKNNGELEIIGYDAWFQVDDLLLPEGGSAESAKDAMKQLFVHIMNLSLTTHIWWERDNLDPANYSDWDPAMW